jgi:hypothetical protein
MRQINILFSTAAAIIFYWSANTVSEECYALSIKIILLPDKLNNKKISLGN